jgi:hypothetical protein
MKKIKVLVVALLLSCLAIPSFAIEWTCPPGDVPGDVNWISIGNSASGVETFYNSRCICYTVDYGMVNFQIRINHPVEGYVISFIEINFINNTFRILDAYKAKDSVEAPNHWRKMNSNAPWKYILEGSVISGFRDLLRRNR